MGIVPHLNDLIFSPVASSPRGSWLAAAPCGSITLPKEELAKKLRAERPRSPNRWCRKGGDVKVLGNSFIHSFSCLGPQGPESAPQARVLSDEWKVRNLAIPNILARFRKEKRRDSGKCLGKSLGKVQRAKTETAVLPPFA